MDMWLQGEGGIQDDTTAVSVAGQMNQTPIYLHLTKPGHSLLVALKMMPHYYFSLL